MIISSLVDYYEQLLAHKFISPMGWSSVGITYVLMLSDDGSVEDICDVRSTNEKGRKIPKFYELPLPAHVTSGIKPSFLSGNSKYFLGLDYVEDSKEEEKVKRQTRAMKCFEESKAFHEAMLADIDTPCANAIKGFFNSWNCRLSELERFAGLDIKLLLTTANLVFHCPSGFAHEDEAIIKAWTEYYYEQVSSESTGVCSVTGKQACIELVHNPPIKMRGAQTSGAALVSFNDAAFLSYGKKQGENASIGKYAAFAYASALNYLLNQDNHTRYIGDTAFIFWAENGSFAYQDFFSMSMFSLNENYSENDLFDMLSHLCAGESVDFEETRLSPDMKFHILGLSPNAGRIAVKFYFENSFGSILDNVRKHHEALKIVSRKGSSRNLTVWHLLNETTNTNSKTDKPAPDLACELIKSIVTGEAYPSTLLNGVVLRMRAERNVSYAKAAILKAYYLKKINKGFDYPEEVLTVSLCKESRSVPYNLGRLFAILVKIQEDAIPGLQTGIRDKYWNSISSTPAHILPSLINLAQKHMKKFTVGQRIYYERMLSEIFSKFEEELPVRLSLPEQGAFQLGYYHQINFLYSKKEEV